ncbi:pyroglutamyl-peptidase I [Microbacterium luticocti]|uniref:pyroglutamyl-peptidase I n=1 Tax=Microbacterium luticocti TaxID=451764 RepID=UPI000409BC87|nr:pyroglutamyl-peptidase I [Microbacterium luticocti]
MAGILLTGFEPFATDRVNPSAEAVRLAADLWPGPEPLVTAVLPVTFDGAARRLRELIAAHDPDVVIATGLAGGRPAVSVERVAVNLVDAGIPDNAGAQPVDVPCVPGGPPAWFATLPVKRIVAAVSGSGIPCALSLSAGSYVCNHVFAHAMDAARPGVRAGFIHVPWGTGQAPRGEPELPVADMARALVIAARTALDEATDAATPGGALH